MWYPYKSKETKFSNFNTVIEKSGMLHLGLLMIYEETLFCLIAVMFE